MNRFFIYFSLLLASSLLPGDLDSTATNTSLKSALAMSNLFDLDVQINIVDLDANESQDIAPLFCCSVWGNGFFIAVQMLVFAPVDENQFSKSDISIRAPPYSYA